MTSYCYLSDIKLALEPYSTTLNMICNPSQTHLFSEAHPTPFSSLSAPEAEQGGGRSAPSRAAHMELGGQKLLQMTLQTEAL